MNYKIGIPLAIGGLKLGYEVLKLLPERKRVCFFSRQSDVPGTDFSMIMERLSEKRPDIEQKYICYRYAGRQDGLVGFGFALLKSMGLLATSRVCLLDGYWPTVSILNHKKSLRVIQIWHAIGKIKQSGYQTVGKKSGRSTYLAKSLKMHRNYDYVIAGGKAWNPYYCEAFDIGEEKIRNYGLPRIDKMLSLTENDVYEKYPELRDEKIVLFAPTFRTYPVDYPLELKEGLERLGYKFVVHWHPRQQAPVGEKHAAHTDENKSHAVDLSNADVFELLRVADYIITDYSSLTLEGAVLGKKVIFYMPDNERYLEENGVNLDFFKEMPGCAFEKPEDVVALIARDEYPWKAMEAFREKYLPEDLGHSTEKIVELIEENIDDEVCNNGGW